MIWVPRASAHSYILTVSHPGLILRPILLVADTTYTDSFDFQNSFGITYVKYLIFSSINGDDLIIGICLLMILFHDDLGSKCQYILNVFTPSLQKLF